jgi:hypothetical protein
MSVPLGFKCILDLDGQNWLIEDGKAVLVDSLAFISGPKIILSDFNHALTGIETVHSAKAYAPAIIEKQLRDRGDMEGASQVLNLDSHKTASALDVFYAAIPIQEYSNYLDIVKAQKDHCLYIPLWNAMLRSADKPISAIVFQHGDVLEVVVADEGVPVHSIRVSSSSYGGQDWDSALNYLATELNQLEADKDFKIDSIKWLSWCSDDALSGLAKSFESLANRLVVVPEKQAIEEGKARFESNVSVLFNNIATSDAIKGDSGKYLFYSERVLPWVAGVVLAISAGAFLAGFNWQQSTQDYIDSAESLLVSSQFDQKSATVKALIANNNNSSSILAADKVDFIDSLHAIAISQSISRVIGDIQSSINPYIHVNNIELNSKEGDSSLGMILEGYVDQDLGFATQQVELLIARLVVKGYQIEDKGFVSKNGNNGFQLILIPGNKE